jgi:hypothetical protein
MGSTGDLADELRRDGKLLAVYLDTAAPCFRFPNWQFRENGQPVRELPHILTVLRKQGLFLDENLRTTGWGASSSGLSHRMCYLTVPRQPRSWRKTLVESWLPPRLILRRFPSKLIAVRLARRRRLLMIRRTWIASAYGEQRSSRARCTYLTAEKPYRARLSEPFAQDKCSWCARFTAISSRHCARQFGKPGRAVLATREFPEYEGLISS